MCHNINRCTAKPIACPTTASTSLEPLSNCAQVAAAMKAAGVAISSDGALSGGGNGLDMSQRSRKCST